MRSGIFLSIFLISIPLFAIESEAASALTLRQAIANISSQKRQQRESVAKIYRALPFSDEKKDLEIKYLILNLDKAESINAPNWDTDMNDPVNVRLKRIFDDH